MPIQRSEEKAVARCRVFPAEYDAGGEQEAEGSMCSNIQGPIASMESNLVRKKSSREGGD